ncbi:hypothetical protein CLI64_24960 [Nostoc sp. CENA543]|uniref:hypothetical protein n=1 Tax=Nostoc sp. CENA543 TaxID=1869241 RepID=UPI000CA305F1|nr:hypothetical protein [Nostoc sp. CENA543]AUT03401.1 hypothetical protein CLI64_24960 [Nostoc sp. CENA543]
MKASIPTVAVATLAVLLGCSTPGVVAPPQKTDSSVTVAQVPTLKDTLIVPGERVGPVTRTTTRKDLAKIFGASSLVDKTIPGAEGIGNFAATQVNLSQGRSFLIVWSDNNRTKPSEVRDLGTAWKTREGIGVGTPWSVLRQKLGDFKLFGLGWDYGGTILLESSKLSRYEGKLIIRVSADTKASERYPQDYQAVSGDRTFASTNRRWQKLGMKVSQIIVILNPS